VGVEDVRRVSVEREDVVRAKKRLTLGSVKGALPRFSMGSGKKLRSGG